MAWIDSSIFRKNDIRGIAIGSRPQLSPAVARAIGRALGTYLPEYCQTERVFIGRDNRLTSHQLKTSLIQGLLSTGLSVTDVGPALTPVIYYASASYGDRGAGVMVTGSHLPVEHNGFKVVYSNRALVDHQILDLLKIIENDSFAESVVPGTLTPDTGIVERYLTCISSMVSLDRPLKVVLDAGNGLSGTFVPQMLSQLGVDVHCLYCESDGSFPHHLPNPDEPELMKDVCNQVVELGADMGLAFDGDADRCGVIDNEGNLISGDRLLIVLARDLLARHPGVPIVIDAKSSQVTYDEIEKHGGIPIIWKTGHSLTMQKMQEVSALLAGDIHGHMFIGEDYYGFDDAPLAALKFLEIVSRTDLSVADMFRDIPSLVTTPEIILPVLDKVKFNIVNTMKETLSKRFPVSDVDGARVSFESGWGLVRASNSQPAVTLRFEASTVAEVVEYMELFHDLISSIADIDGQRLTLAIESLKESSQNG